MFTTIVILPALLSLPPAELSAVELPPLDLALAVESAGSIEPYAYTSALDALVASAETPDAGGNNGWYLRVNAGAVTTTSSDGPSEDIDFNEGWLAAVAIGNRLTDGHGAVDFDLELEGVFTQQDADDNPALDDVTSIAPYLNGVFDFHLSDTFSLYAGAGIGAAWVDVGTNSDSLNDFDDEDGPFLTWQLKAGLMFRMSPSTAFTLGYRFRNIDDVQIEDELNNNSFDLQTEQHVLELGVVFGL
jgi:opacity protein-like surface antigen